MNCVICGKPLGFEAAQRGKTVCKKHKHIVLSHFPEEEVSQVQYLGFFDANGVERQIVNLELYQTAIMEGIFLVARNVN